MSTLVAGLTSMVGLTALVPALMNPAVHTPYLNGFLDLPGDWMTLGSHAEPENALTVVW